MATKEISKNKLEIGSLWTVDSTEGIENVENEISTKIPYKIMARVNEYEINAYGNALYKVTFVHI